MDTVDRFTFGWFVGPFEGEGTFTFLKGKPKKIAITMTDLDVLQRVQANFGGNIYKIKAREAHWKQAWIWQISGDKSVRLANHMLPSLSVRRAGRCVEYINGYITAEMHKDRVKSKSKEWKDKALTLNAQGLTHQQIADKVGKDRTTVTKFLKIG